jgi:hypothetical protein
MKVHFVERECALRVHLQNRIVQVTQKTDVW